jgi:hypothetical protein
MDRVSPGLNRTTLTLRESDERCITSVSSCVPAWVLGVEDRAMSPETFISAGVATSFAASEQNAYVPTMNRPPGSILDTCAACSSIHSSSTSRVVSPLVCLGASPGSSGGVGTSASTKSLLPTPNFPITSPV